jgi:predicted dehydrogenase
MNRTFSRRGFLNRTMLAAGTLGTPLLIPASALGRDGRPAPSDRINMGCIGLGGKGRGNMRQFLEKPGVEVVALCDVDKAHLRQALDLIEGTLAEQSALARRKGCATYGDFRELIARRDIDAISIATPDHWHAIPVIHAAREGKDMYCEKPLSLTIAEGRAMSDAVRHSGVVFLTGSQQRSDRNFRFACELVRSGRIGRLHTVRVGLPPGHACPPQPEMPVPKGFNYDMWLGPAPWAPYTEQRCHNNFRWIQDYSGGQITDWAAHHCDIAHWGMGVEHTGPVEVEGRGDFPRDGLWNTAVSYRFECVYANGIRMICASSLPIGVRFEGDDGWVFVTRGQIEAEPKGLLRSSIGPNETQLPRVSNHFDHFIECVKLRCEPIAPIETAHRSITVGHLGNISMLLQRKVRWNPELERFDRDTEADRLRSRAMRGPWSL